LSRRGDRIRDPRHPRGIHSCSLPLHNQHSLECCDARSISEMGHERRRGRFIPESRRRGRRLWLPPTGGLPATPSIGPVSSESSHWDEVPNKKVCSSQLRLRPRKVQIALGTKYVAVGLALVSLRATRAGPVCLIEFPEQLSEPVREMILWRKLILQRFT
jgi:hypothetical protein